MNQTTLAVFYRTDNVVMVCFANCGWHIDDKGDVVVMLMLMMTVVLHDRGCFSFVSQVSRLLLLAGANPNELTESLNGAPALCIAAREGHVDLVSLYLEFGADVNAYDDSYVPALSYAAQQGHVNIIHLLTIQHAKVLLDCLFTALHVMQMRYSEENSVCLSVRPSHA